jgi:hypothetical protein
MSSSTMQRRFSPEQSPPESLQPYSRLLPESRLPPASAHAIAPRSREEACERATGFLQAQLSGPPEECGPHWSGIQANIAAGPLPHEQLDLQKLFASGVGAGETKHPLAQWAEKKLGFPLEPELFSNMLFVATLGACGDARLEALGQRLLTTFRDTDADGLYHFFRSLKFACDLDCTGVAARACLVTGDLKLEEPAGVARLKRTANRIYRSAATRDVSAAKNESYGKQNGALYRHVFKVYPDDHDVQGAECDRGLKNNPVVVVNAIYPVLLELKLGQRSLSDRVALCEYMEGEPEPRRGEASVAELLIANVRYVAWHLMSGEYRDGCRYYASPDTFLCFFSELIRDFPELFESLGVSRRLAKAIEERRKVESQDVALNPLTSLNTALRAVAAANVGVDRSFELDLLLRCQGDDGAWNELDSLYTFGTARQIHFRSPLLTTAFALRALLPRPTQPLAPALRHDWIDPVVKALHGTSARPP